MKCWISIIVFFFLFSLKAEKDNTDWEKDYKKNVSLKIDKIKKRNEPGCERLGNQYGSCEWIVVINIKNNTKKPLKQFCTYMKVNQRKFDFCYGSKKKVLLKRNYEKNVLLNLYELIKFPNNFEQPIVTLYNEKFIF